MQIAFCCSAKYLSSGEIAVLSHIQQAVVFSGLVSQWSGAMITHSLSSLDAKQWCDAHPGIPGVLITHSLSALDAKQGCYAHPEIPGALITHSLSAFDAEQGCYTHTGISGAKITHWLSVLDTEQGCEAPHHPLCPVDQHSHTGLHLDPPQPGRSLLLVVLTQ